MAPVILDLDTKRRCVVKFTTQRFTNEEKSQYPLNGRLSEGPQKLLEHFGEKYKALPLPGIEPRITQPLA